MSEGQTAVGTIVASDPDAGDTLTYSIVLPEGSNGAGADGAKFSIDPVTGALAFIAPPDFEAPGDVGANNVYQVTIRVADGNGGTATQAVSARASITPAGGTPASAISARQRTKPSSAPDRNKSEWLSTESGEVQAGEILHHGCARPHRRASGVEDRRATAVELARSERSGQQGRLKSTGPAVLTGCLPR